VWQAGDGVSLTLDQPEPGGVEPTSVVFLRRWGGRWCLSYGAGPP
jgi:hypothetical protein